MTATPSFNYSELFTPAASGVGSGNPLSPASGTWMSFLLSVAASQNLPTTAWQSGGPELSIYQSLAVKFSETDANISIMNQGGFLDFAATGSVTYVAANGITIVAPVTPDPSIPSQNPTGSPGWLDVLGSMVYGTTRISASFATNTLAIVNTSGVSSTAYSPGGYHVANPGTGATYHNRDSLTIAPSSIVGTSIVSVTGTLLVTVQTQTVHGLTSGQTVFIPGAQLQGVVLSASFATVVVTSTTTFQLVGVTASGTWTSGGVVYLCVTPVFAADVIGPTGTSAPGTISETVTSNAGVLVSNTVPFVGNAFESNVAYAARCRLSLASRSPNGAANAYEFFALTASQILSAETPPLSLSGGAIVKALVQGSPITGIVTVTLANTNPASNVLGANVVEGVTNLLVIGAGSNAGAVQLQVSSTTGINTNDSAIVAGVLGTIEANGEWLVNVDDSTHITLQGSTFTNTYTGGGTIEAGDLGLVDNLLQTTCTPDDTTLVTQSATSFPITINATVVVPSAQATNYAATAQSLVAAFVQAIDIGGTVIPPSSTGVVEISVLEGTLVAAGIVGANSTFVRAVTVLTVNGSSTNVPFPSAISNAVLASFNLTLVKV